MFSFLVILTLLSIKFVSFVMPTVADVVLLMPHLVLPAPMDTISIPLKHVFLALKVA